jgi:transcriptional regulator with XRE-family HTH domain
MAYSKFGQWLDGELNRRGLKQADLYRALDLTSGGVSAWFTGRSKPSPETCSRIAVYLGVPEIEVLRAAGISTSRPVTSPVMEGIIDLGGKLSEEDQIDILDFIKTKLARHARSKEANK